MISDIIGSVDHFGGRVNSGLSPKKREEALMRARTTSPVVRVRLRSKEQRDLIQAEFRASITNLLAEVAKNNTLTIVLDRRANPGTRRMEVDRFTVGFNDRGEADVPFDVALRLLSCDRYQRLVEEVASTTSAPKSVPTAPMTPREAADFASLKRSLEAKETALDERLAQLDALIAAQVSAKSEAPSPTTNSSTKKSSKKKG